LETGWFQTFKSGEPVDAEMKAIPWFTYSAIDFLEERLNDNLNILEFGSGNSTLYLAERVKKVTAIEHNDRWFQNILHKNSNVEKLVSSIESKIIFSY
jgi:tRNA/tmRNA/rRNA uracil-C5-methylase (TrmA/RlmC/RlmD family)